MVDGHTPTGTSDPKPKPDTADDLRRIATRVVVELEQAKNLPSMDTDLYGGTDKAHPSYYPGYRPPKTAIDEELALIAKRANPEQAVSAMPYKLPAPAITAAPASRGFLGRRLDRYRCFLASYDISNLDNDIDAFKVYAADFNKKFGERLRTLLFQRNDGYARDRLLNSFQAFGSSGYLIYCTPETMHHFEKNLFTLQSRITDYLKSKGVESEASLKRLRLTRLKNKEMDLIDAYTAVVNALPEMKAHPFIATMLPQIPLLEARMERREKAIANGEAKKWNATNEPRADWLAALQAANPQPEPLDLSTLDAEVATLKANAQDFYNRFINDSTGGKGSKGILTRAEDVFENNLHDNPGRDSLNELSTLITALNEKAANATPEKQLYELPDALFERIRVQLEDIKPYFEKFCWDYDIHDDASLEAAREKDKLSREQHYKNGDSRFRQFDTFKEFIKILPEIEKHPFITESAPQMPVIKAKYEKRSEIALAEEKAREEEEKACEAARKKALEAPRAQFLQELLAPENNTPQLKHTR
jgi:hypothetical protein